MSETTNLKLFKHDNPETNEEQFDIDNYLNGNWNKIEEKDTDQDNRISQLQTEKVKLETELKEMQEDFYQASIRGQASGEYIHVEDSSNCRARIGISGNSEQETSSQGKNLLTLQEDKYTAQGVNVTLNKNQFVINGTTTSAGNLFKQYGNIATYIFLGNFKAGTYTVSSQLISGSWHLSESGARTAFYIRNASQKTLATLNLSNSTSKMSLTFTLTEDADLYAQYYENMANIVFDNYTVNFQLENGSISTDIEQFVPNMPSPDYPSEIKTVGDNINLLNNTLQSQSINGVDVEVKDGEIHLNGIATENFELVVGTLENISNMIISGMCDGYGFSKMMMQVQGKDYNVNVPNSNPVLLDELHSVANVRLYIYKSTNIENAVIKPKIEKGSTATPYSPYGQGSVKVTKCNKNIFNEYIKGIWYGTTSYIANANTVGFIAKVKPNTTYTIKKKNQGNRFIILAGQEPVKIGNSFIRNVFSSNHDLTQYTFTTKENEYYIFLGVYNGTDENELVLAVEETQLEQNPTATNYEEHQEQSYIMPTQQPLRAIGDYKDTFIKKDGKWYERHYIARKVFDGIVNKFNFKHNSIYTNTRGLYQLSLEGKVTGTSGSIAYGKSNYLKYKNGNAQNAIYLDCLWWENTSNYNYASIPFLSLTEANEWLVKLNDNGNPFYIDYVLAEPVDIECTEEQSKILDELNNARTYKNVTNITTDSKAVLDLDYVKDLETLITSNQKVEEV